MLKWFSRRSQLSTLVVATCIAALLGAYVNILTGKLASASLEQTPKIVASLGSWNILLVLALILLFLQYRISRLAQRRLVVNADDIINDILAAACRSMTFPSVNRHIRGIVTLRDGNSGYRVTRYTYNAIPDPERVASLPLDFGVTGEAYISRSAIVRELKEGHVMGLPPEIQPLIFQDLRTVLAAPLLASNEGRDAPLGVLAFDSVLPPHTLHFDRPEARELAQRWADIIAKLLIIKEG